MDLLRKVLTGILTGGSAIWFANQAITGHGALRIFSVLMLILAAATAGLNLHDRLRPRPKKRRAREQDDLP
jgi:cephalosporin hydroxylase